MPARKRRRDLTAADPAQVSALHEAAARAERLLDWLEAAKPVEAPDLPLVVEAAPAPARRRLWPFGRSKADPEAERAQALLAELEGVARDRPTAAARAREQAPEVNALALEQRLRAAG